MGWNGVEAPTGVSRGWPGQSFWKGPTGDNPWGTCEHRGVPTGTAQDLLQGFLQLQDHGGIPRRCSGAGLVAHFPPGYLLTAFYKHPAQEETLHQLHLPVLLSPGTGTGLAQARGGNLSCWGWGFGAAFCRGFVLFFFFCFSTAHFSLANVWEKGVLCCRLNSLRSSSQLVRGGSRWALGS